MRMPPSPRSATIFFTMTPPIRSVGPWPLKIPICGKQQVVVLGSAWFNNDAPTAQQWIQNNNLPDEIKSQILPDESTPIIPRTSLTIPPPNLIDATRPQ